MIGKPTIALTSGCFDGYHIGHQHFLREMRGLADLVFVAINSDDYIRRRKHREPLNTATVRRAHILGSGLADMVYIYDEDGPLDLVMRFRPDVIVAGSDYAVDQIVGAKECAAWGGRVVIVPRIPGISTTEILKQKDNLS